MYINKLYKIYIINMHKYRKSSNLANSRIVYSIDQWFPTYGS